MFCIVVALQSELNEFLNNVAELKKFKILDKTAYSGKILGQEAIIAVSGIGKVSAALTTQILIDKYNPSFILNFGTCGGINDMVKICNYYAVERCCQYDFDLTDLEDVPLGYIQEYDSVFFNVNTIALDFLEKRCLASADRFTCKQKDVDSINQLGCSICDMEGGAIAQVCTSNRIPLFMIKGISDVHGSQSAPEQFVKNLNTVGKYFPDVVLKAIKNICKQF